MPCYCFRAGFLVASECEPKARRVHISRRTRWLLRLSPLRMYGKTYSHSVHCVGEASWKIKFEFFIKIIHHF